MAKFLIISPQHFQSIQNAFGSKRNHNIKIARRMESVTELTPLLKPEMDELQGENKAINGHIENSLGDVTTYGSITAMFNAYPQLLKYKHYIYENFSRHKLNTYFVDDFNMLIIKTKEKFGGLDEELKKDKKAKKIKE